MLSREFVTEFVSVNDLRQLKRQLNQLYKMIGIDVRFSRHFADRVNDPRNGKDITVEEIARLFSEVYKEHGRTLQQLGPAAEVLLTDLSTKLNVPVVFDLDRTTQDLDMVAKTIMRKNNYKTHTKTLPVK